MTGEKERCIAAGMNDFMVKPLVKAVLADMFHKWIDPSNRKDLEKVEVEKTTEVEHLNRTWFRQYASDDNDFKGKFIELARTGIKDSASELKSAIQNRDLKAINESGHKLKGTSLAVGLTQLSKFAVAFELLESFEEEYVHDLLESLLYEVKVVDELLNHE